MPTVVIVFVALKQVADGLPDCSIVPLLGLVGGRLDTSGSSGAVLRLEQSQRPIESCMHLGGHRGLVLKQAVEVASLLGEVHAAGSTQDRQAPGQHLGMGSLRCPTYDTICSRPLRSQWASQCFHHRCLPQLHSPWLLQQTVRCGVQPGALRLPGGSSYWGAITELR